jgi:hypothetical protein
MLISGVGLELKQLRAIGKLNGDKKKKYKQYWWSLQSNGDRALQMMSLEDSLPSISDLINSPLSKYITLAAHVCGYDGTAEELIIQYMSILCSWEHILLQARRTTLGGMKQVEGSLPMTTGKPWKWRYSLWNQLKHGM